MDYNFNDGLDNANSLFDKEYFENMNLDEDMEKIYSLIKDEEEYDDYEKDMNLSRMRIENHKKYHRIKLDLIEDLPNYFYLDVKNIKNIYSKINEKKLLTANYKESEKNKYRLLEISKAYDELKNKVEKELNKLIKSNNADQKLWDYSTFKNLTLDKDELKKVLNYYDTLLTITTKVFDNIFSEYKNEIIRKKIIDKIKKFLDEEAEKLKNSAKLREIALLNEKIEKQLITLNNKLEYLDKLVKENSEYLSDYDKFKVLCDTLINYDKNSLEEARETYKMICLQDKLDIFIKRFETLFLQEIENDIKGKNYEKFEQDKLKIKDIIKNIEKNYYEFLNKEEARYIRILKLDIASKIANINDAKEKINKIAKKIWHNYLTDVYLYNPSYDYHFICTNNQFIEPKDESILITKNFIDKIENYENYQIGFICNDNILYVTEKEDIMEASEEEKKYLRLPNEVESNFISFNKCNKIVLDGNSTVFTAVYFIDDNDVDKLNTAIELANTYNIPLIRLKKR